MKYIQETKEYIENAINNLPLSEEVKNNMHKSVFGPLAFYTFLPIEILQSCNIDSKEKKDLVNQLSLYAIYYVSAVIFTDKLMDAQVKEASNSLLFEYLFFIKEYAVRGLEKIVGSKEFWDNIDTYKRDLFCCSKFTNKSFEGNDKQLIDVLVGKSALIKSYPEAMQRIMGDTIDWKSLNKALYDFHVAFQILDDYEDLVQDAESDQLNFFLVKNKALFDEDIEVRIKKIYLNGSIVNGMGIAIRYIKESIDYFQKSGMNYLSAIAQKLHNRLANIYFEVDRLCQKAKVKAQLSNNVCNNNNLSNAIKHSLQFLFKRRNEKNRWSDFMTTAGKGEAWITAYVICMLGEFSDNRSKLIEIIRELEKNGGQYNDRVIPDGDSLNFLVMALTLVNDKNNSIDTKKWLYYKHDSGGFSTYRGNAISKVLHIDSDSDVSGWTIEHNCVTAVALWVAQKLGMNNIINEVESFLTNQVRKDGSIASYWWTEDIYANAFCVMAGMRGNVLNYIIKMRQDEGCWYNMGEPSVFYTALAIKALECVTINDHVSDYVPFIKESINWLLKHQFEDGSWQSENLLRIPAPNVHAPEDIKQWKFSSFGVNVITDDYERVFTTALVYNVLRTYADHIA